MISLRAASGTLLVLSFFFMLAGAMLWFTRRGALPPAVPSGRVYVERGLIVSAVAVTAIGLLLLEALLRDGDGLTFAVIGAGTYLLAAAMIMVAEGILLSSGQGNSALIVFYVVLALLGQATVGASLIQSGVVPLAIGWVTIVWNLGALVALPLVSPSDMYFPFIHHMMPLVIGASLLLGM